MMVFGLTKLKMNNNYDADLPTSNYIVKTNKYIEKVFGEKAIVLIGIESDDIYSKRTLQKIAQISEEIKTIDGVIEDEILSLSLIDNIYSDNEMLQVEPFYDVNNLENVDEQEIRAAVEKNQLIKGKLVSNDGKATIVIANIQKGYDQAKVYKKLNEILKKYSGPEKLYSGGDPIEAQEIDIGIQNDMMILLPIALLLLILGLGIIFKSFFGILLPLMIVVLDIIWTLGTMGLLHLPITVVTSAIPMLLIAITISYGVHFLFRYFDENENTQKQKIISTIKHISIPIFLAGITSAIGMGSLVTFKISSIKQFGIATSIGIIYALFLTITLIPAFLTFVNPKIKRTTNKKQSKITFWLLSVVRFSMHKKYLVLVATLILIIFSIFGISKILIGEDLASYFPKSHPMTKTFKFFNEKMGGSQNYNIVIEGNDVDAIKDPVLLRKIVEFQKYAENIPEIGYTYSFADIIKHIHYVMNDGKVGKDELPDSKELIAQYLLLYFMGGDPDDFDDLVDNDYRRAKIRVMVETNKQEKHVRIFNELKKYFDTNFSQKENIQFGGFAMISVATIQYIVQGKIFNIITSLILVLIVCTIIFRSLVAGVLSILPLTISTLFTFGIMGFLKFRLDMSTAIISGVAVGIGVDFAIHFIDRLIKEKKAIDDWDTTIEQTTLASGIPILNNVLLNVVGFSIFLFSGFLPIRYFGFLVSIIMLTSGLSVFVIIPAVIKCLPGNIQNKIVVTKKKLYRGDAL
jgi:hydrophobe/amphiphile efflux-3 (HAE3) family protein